MITVTPPATPITTAETTGDSQNPVIVVTAVIIGLRVGVYLAWLRPRKSVGK